MWLLLLLLLWFEYTLQYIDNVSRLYMSRTHTYAAKLHFAPKLQITAPTFYHLHTHTHLHTHCIYLHLRYAEKLCIYPSSYLTQLTVAFCIYCIFAIKFPFVFSSSALMGLIIIDKGFTATLHEVQVNPFEVILMAN